LFGISKILELVGPQKFLGISKMLGIAVAIVNLEIKGKFQHFDGIIIS